MSPNQTGTPCKIVQRFSRILKPEQDCLVENLISYSENISTKLCLQVDGKPKQLINKKLVNAFLHKCFHFFFEEVSDDTIGDSAELSLINKQLDPNLTKHQRTAVSSETICNEYVNLEPISDQDDNLYNYCENNPTNQNVALNSKNQCSDIDSYFIKKLEHVTGLDYPKAPSIDSAIKLAHAVVSFTNCVLVL